MIKKLLMPALLATVVFSGCNEKRARMHMEEEREKQFLKHGQCVTPCCTDVCEPPCGNPCMTSCKTSACGMKMEKPCRVKKPKCNKCNVCRRKKCICQAEMPMDYEYMGREEMPMMPMNEQALDEEDMYQDYEEDMPRY